jgi:hypothetical protein
MVKISCPELTHRDDFKYLKYSFRSRDYPDAAEDINLKRGIKYAVINELANVFPGSTNLVEVMHCVYLCMFSRFCVQVYLYHS